MRTATISVCTAALITASLSAASYGEPLAPGKPAGVRAAQMGNKEWLVFGGLGVVAAAILIGSAGGGHDTVPNQAITVVTPTTS